MCSIRFGPGQVALPQRRRPRVADEGGPGGDCSGPGRRSMALVVAVGGGGSRTRHRLHHEPEELVLVGDVVVERHHLEAEPLGQPPHRQGLNADSRQRARHRPQRSCRPRAVARFAFALPFALPFVVLFAVLFAVLTASPIGRFED